MSRRRRRRVKIKSSSRLFAFILFNLLLLASCATAHYLEDQHLEQLPLTEANQQQVAPAAGYLPPANKYAEQSFDLPTPLVGGTATSNQQQHQLQQPQRVEVAAAPQSLSNYQSSQQQTFESATNLEAQLQPTEVNNYFQQHTTQNSRFREQQSSQQQNNNQQVVVASSLPSVQSLCAQVPTVSARHLKLCKLASHSPQADEAVALGAARGLAECRAQFRNEKWNCTHTGGEHHLLTSRFAQSLGNREGAFVQAIAAAGIVHSIATACSVGSLSDCACDKSRVGLVRQRDQTWKWGGCSNNIRHGMMFARHLVELLDAVHEQQQLQHHHQMQRSLSSTSSSSSSSSITTQQQHYKSHHHRHHRPHHQMSKRQISAASPRQQPVAGSHQFCQKNQNISQTTHLQLIKSLLAKNSLERHQDFRLAMNIHNNKVGRMAVANNMERVCRCHGLSGSCSLKTCWLKLPDFQQVGAYLRRKYEVSVHLPVAVNVNKLIPMMDRQELSTILQLQGGSGGGGGGVGGSDSLQEEQALSAGTTTQPAGIENSLAAAVSSSGQPEYAALTHPLDEHATPTSPNLPSLLSGGASGQPPVHFGYYERHRQLEQRQRATGGAPPTTVGQAGISNSTKLYLHGETEPIPVEPMSQQQYQALLRDTRLCSAAMNSSSPSLVSHTVNTRDLNTFDATSTGSRSQLPVRRKSAQASNSIHNQDQKPPVAATTISSLGPGGQQFKFTSAHLSHLLQVEAAREDLIHLHTSPEYCKADQRHGYAGVTGRVCSATKGAANSCDKLCCKNGFEQRVTQLKTACKCEFYFCCKIQCKMCEETRVEHVCR